jgi:competence protein ComEC
LFGFALGVWAACVVGLWLDTRLVWWLAAAVTGSTVAVLLARMAIAATEQPESGRWAVVAGRAPRARHRRQGQFTWTVVAVLLGAGCGLASTAARTAARDAEPLASLARARADVEAELTVTDDPRPLRASTYLIPAELSVIRPSVGGEAVRLRVRVLIFADDAGWPGLLPSQRLVARARLSPPRPGDLTAAVLTATGPPRLSGRPSWTQLAAGALRDGLRRACAALPPEPGGLLPGLILGDTSRLDPTLADEFRTTGLTHLVAVSGANVAILLGVVLFVARWCRAGPWLAAGVAALSLAGFVILVRPSPSVVRAAAMGAIALLALALGRAHLASSALATASVIALLLDPTLAVDAGFALSVLATAALILLAPRWRDGLSARGVPAPVAEALAVPAAAQVACAPVIVALSGQVSLVALPANLLAAPAVAPITVLGVAATVLSTAWPPGGAALVWLAAWPARWLVAVAHAGAAVPGGSVAWLAGLPGGVVLGALTTAALVATRYPLVRRISAIVALAVAVGVVPVRLFASAWPPTGAILVMCDVGQGDAIVLPDGSGEAVVVDTGPDPAPVDACLRRLGVHDVTLLVITHFHADHVGGIAGVIHGRRVESIALPAYDEPAAGYRAVRDTNLPMAEADVGWTYRHGPLALELLGPVRELTGTRSDPNNNSLVVRARVDGRIVLLEGDAENDEQHTLVTDLGTGALAADVLKVAHHGSSYQDIDALDAVHARIALVSVGAGNPYGHPNLAVLQRLARNGARVLRTDLAGDIAVVATSSGLAVTATKGLGAMA